VVELDLFVEGVVVGETTFVEFVVFALDAAAAY
jgi:hypothetical protein